MTPVRITLCEPNQAWLTLRVTPQQGVVELPTGGIVMRDGAIIEYSEHQISPGLSLYDVVGDEPYDLYVQLVGGYRTVLQIAGVVVTEFLELHYDSLIDLSGTVELLYNGAIFDNITLPKPVPRTVMMDGVQVTCYSTRMTRKLNVSRPDVEVAHIAGGMHGTYDNQKLTVTLLHRPIMPGPYFWRTFGTNQLPYETQLELSNGVLHLPSEHYMVWSYTVASGIVTAYTLPELVNALTLVVGSTKWRLDRQRARMI